MKKFLIGFISGAVLCGSLAAVAVEYNIYPNPYKVMVDGKETAIEGYNINDKSYFQLRDIGSAVGFQVGFDAANGTVLVSTDPNVVMPDTNADPAPTESVEPSTELERVKASVSNTQHLTITDMWEEDGLIWIQTSLQNWITLDSYIKKYNLTYSINGLNELTLTNGVKTQEHINSPLFCQFGDVIAVREQILAPFNWD